MYPITTIIGSTKMSKTFIAFFLGLFSFFLGNLFYMFGGETLLFTARNVGLAETFILMAVYFFICQYLLSRGNPDAFPKDWPIMLALDAVLLLALIPLILIARLELILTLGLGILLFCCGSTVAGAFAASKAAVRKAARK